MMSEPTQDDPIQKQLYNRLSEKETEELVAIWQENDRGAWSEAAFAAIQKILLERLGELPEQAPPVDEGDDADDADEGQYVPRYPNDNRLIWLAETSKMVSWAALAVGLVYAVLKLGYYFWVQFPPAQWTLGRIYHIVAPVADQLDSLLYAGFAFLVLQAITEIIYLLMDIRDNTTPPAADEETPAAE